MTLLRMNLKRPPNDTQTLSNEVAAEVGSAVGLTAAGGQAVKTPLCLNLKGSPRQAWQHI